MPGECDGDIKGLFMWKWLRRYREGIFRYFDGTRWRCADPIAVFRSLQSHPEFDLATTPKMAGVDDPKIKFDAIRKCADAVRVAFGVQPLDDTGAGLTEEECCALLVRFSQFAEGLKKSTSTQPTSPPSTASTSSEESTTKPASDSG